MSYRKAPSEGTKVTAGQNAPVYQEGAGLVNDSSLAADSARSGGVFSENRGANSDEQQYSGSTSRRSGAGGGGSSGAGGFSSSLENQESYGGTAPSYVNSQYRRDPAGPHGKNLRENEGFDGARPSNSLDAEPGSDMDPGRAAERGFQQSQTRAGRDAGPRQAGVEGGHWYEPLDNERSA